MKFTIPIRIRSSVGTFQSADWPRKRRRSPQNAPARPNGLTATKPPRIVPNPLPVVSTAAPVPLPVPTIAQDRQRVTERLEKHVAEKGKLKPVSEILPKKPEEKPMYEMKPIDGKMKPVAVKEPTLRERKRIKRENVKLARETKREAKIETPKGKPAAWTCITQNCKNYGKRFETIQNFQCPGCFRKFQPMKG